MGRRKPPSRKRVVQIGGRRFISLGLPHHFGEDLYHRALTIRWPTFFALAATAFVALNLVFAAIYMLGDHPIANQFPAGFTGAFFFSVETLSTVGYGDMHPQTLYAHLVATAEIFTGMGMIAVMTGLIFARFSRPRAKIIFADHPLVLVFEGKLTLMIRAANARQNEISSAAAELHLLKRHISPEGHQIRRIIDLPLLRARHPNFMLSWSVMHVIDEHSPLHGETPASLAAADASLMLSIEGIDQTTSQSMHGSRQWRYDEIRWNHRYVDLVQDGDHGDYVLDYSRFQDVVAQDDEQA